ncbi:alanine--tRNA ligase [Candidatus Woesearchaeota archaeon]|nr:alanine--tRNA ligase [Candidatus Woesearchaeota archaeon]
MRTDKQIKKEFKLKASKDPDKYYATEVLKAEGFMRKRCSKCNTAFWTVNQDQDVCGDPACSGGFSFIGNTPAAKELDYIQVWKRFAELFKKWGYTPIQRYPVAARWRDDTEIVQASIYDFQPYVVSGEVDPPANPLVVPQFCLRFNDIDNVGITGAHYTGFVMIGQHAFMPPERWDQKKFFTDIHNWLKHGLGLPNEEITFHEDAWAGGGNFGPCMEYFSRGLELGNQVYMMYEQTPSGPKELKLKVLDMGMGHERNAWFTKGTSTSYETTFPTVAKKLYSATGIKVDQDVMRKFLPYSSFLNVDEVDDINKVWQEVAAKISIDTDVLKEKVLPLAALYSVAEHTRALLVAFNDGLLPSNVGGGYNLRVILRRALSFIDKYGWNLQLPDIAAWHADYLKPIFPELSENLSIVDEILDVEKQKYESTRQKSRQVISKMLAAKIDEKKLLELYDSQGISPEVIAEEAKVAGKDIKVPEDFYARVAELHEKKEQAHATAKEEKLPLDGVPPTKALYFDDYSRTDFRAKVVKVTGKNIILDQTCFYPTSGGQLHDLGIIQNEKVVDVFKQGNVIVHSLAGEHQFPEGEEVECHVDPQRRKQLAQHHTATHIVNAAARKVLGPHVNQAGAKKTEEKAHLDITHFRSVSDEELKQIEKEANVIVESDAPVKCSFMSRNDAEKKYGMSIYQGGAVPGKEIRIVEIPGTDVEACAGTHLKHTGEVGTIRMLKSSKIQDGIVRLVYTAGKAAEQTSAEAGGLLEEAAELLGVKPSQVPARAKQLFSAWKKARKAVKKGKELDPGSLKLDSKEETEPAEALELTAKLLNTQAEHVPRTISRFMKELEEFKEKIS